MAFIGDYCCWVFRWLFVFANLASSRRGVRAAGAREWDRNEFKHEDCLWLSWRKLSLLWKVEGALFRWKRGDRFADRRSASARDAGEELPIQWQREQFFGASQCSRQENKSLLQQVKALLHKGVWSRHYADLRKSLRVWQLATFSFNWGKYVQSDFKVWLRHDSLHSVVLLQSDKCKKGRALQIQHNKSDQAR